MQRMWINQPSTLQPLHKLHGTLVLAVEDRPNNMRVYFTSGDTISMDADPQCLSNGWPEHLQHTKELLAAIDDYRNNISGGNKSCGHDFFCSCADDRLNNAIEAMGT